VLDRRHLLRPLTAYGFGPLTSFLTVASVVVFILSKFGTDEHRIMPLFISNYWQEGDYIHWLKALPEVRHGQIWRVVTPIFIHFNVLHIFFNLLWLRDLGSMIEARQSSLYLGVLVLALAVASNLAQYYYAGPAFGGMSGVIYGLLGYIWIRGKLDPGSGLFLHPTTVMMMIVWFVLCWTPVLGSWVANMTHTVGLFMGMAWGYLASVRYR
jgi:GlpG protein